MRSYLRLLGEYETEVVVVVVADKTAENDRRELVP